MQTKTLKLTAIHIIFAMFLIGCKKHDECDMVRIEIESSRGFVNIDNKTVKTPALFYWNVGTKHEIQINGSWTGDVVKVSIYKELNLHVSYEQTGIMKFIYEVQP
jgi:hypothetical protein